MLCYASMLAVTFAGNMPINRRMLEMDTDSVLGEELVGLKRCWDRFHAVRNALNFLEFVPSESAPSSALAAN
jgi:hypothetical protein